MKHESLDVPAAYREGKVQIGKSLIVIARWDSSESKMITLQNFFRDGSSFIPVFSSWASFDQGVKGSGFEEEGLEIDRDLLLSILNGNELLILNPGDRDPVKMTKADLADTQGGVRREQ